MTINTFGTKTVSPATPLAAKGDKTQLVAQNTACAAAGAYTSAGVINVGEGPRYLSIYLAVNAAAAGNIISLLPLMANEPTAPGATDDLWFLPSVWDGTVTAGTLTAASLPAGTDFTVSPDWGRALHRQLDLRTEPADGATDEQRIIFRIALGEAKFVQILYAEAGVVGTPASVGIWYALGA